MKKTKGLNSFENIIIKHVAKEGIQKTEVLSENF